MSNASEICSAHLLPCFFCTSQNNLETLIMHRSWNIPHVFLPHPPWCSITFPAKDSWCSHEQISRCFSESTRSSHLPLVCFICLTRFRLDSMLPKKRRNSTTKSERNKSRLRQSFNIRAQINSWSLPKLSSNCCPASSSRSCRSNAQAATRMKVNKQFQDQVHATKLVTNYWFLMCNQTADRYKSTTPNHFHSLLKSFANQLPLGILFSRASQTNYLLAIKITHVQLNCWYS